MKKGLFIILAVLLFFTIESGTDAAQAPILLPTGLDPGDSYQLAFITSADQVALSADINYYNTVVNNAAELAGIGSTAGYNWSAMILRIPVKSAADSGRFRPAVPVDPGRSFRWIQATCSG
jgi:hypothetical protein